MGQCASRRTNNNNNNNGGISGGGGYVHSERHQGCFAMVKEHKSRFYIARRCIVMLLCWHKYGKY
ncbi:hypothetical protein S83_014646 [Arachis hypogaea]|uniref:Uncharacterized protein n=1 Tax=Arachis hypogaea TaxID=3818 RepID=A0A444WUS4_ARAHY|nr:hypothetical protein Ahy_Scaffold1g107172 [Arachis hypogaea]